MMIPGQDLGVKLQGLLGWLGNYGHLPYEKQQELLWELGKIEVGVGTLVATNQRISRAINQSVNHLQNWINSSYPPLNIDETPWSVKGIEAFKHHRVFRETLDEANYFDWAAKFKVKVQQTLARWQNPCRL